MPRLRLKLWIRLFAFIAVVVVFFHIFYFSQDKVIGKSINTHVKDTPGVSGNSDRFFYKYPILKKQLGNYEISGPHRTGPGENGAAYFVPRDAKEEEQRLIRKFGFNMAASNRISFDRSAKDLRDNECKYWHYPEDLPTASVIIVFHNEPFGTLVRTAHSMINNIPRRLLAEVVLLDDASTRGNLGEDLENHMRDNYGDLVKIVRTQSVANGRQGLIRARIVGAQHATRGQVLVFVDAHCEANPNYYPPLAAPIAQNRKAVTVPLVDVIDAKTFEYRTQSTFFAQGGFDWDFNYKRYEVPARERSYHEHKTEPYWSPVMAGGLFAIEKNFFWELGGYDKGLEVWGAEQYEISFKTWMCGGEILFVPCSRIGHIYRPYVPGYVAYDPLPGPKLKGIGWGDLNHMRVAEVWMDEYKEYYYISKPFMRNKDCGDLSEMRQIRKQCNADPNRNSFKWFMENVAYSLTKFYPTPSENVAWGQFECQDENRYCLDKMGASYGNEIGASHCHGYGGSQLWRITTGKELRSNEHCISSRGDALIVVFCHGEKNYFIWVYDKATLQIKHEPSGKCVENTSGTKLGIRPCSGHSSQKWKVTPVLL